MRYFWEFLVLFAFTLGGSLLAGKIAYRESWLKSALFLGGSLLLGTVCTHILPELFASSSKTSHWTGLYVLLGFLFQLFLDIAGGSMAHGHTCHSKKTYTAKRIPLVNLLLALCCHALLEGVILGSRQTQIRLMVGIILLHKIPAAFMLGLMLRTQQCSSILEVIFLSLFALATPLGFLFSTQIGWENSHLLNAIAAGTMLHISTTILAEANPQHRISFHQVLLLLLSIGLNILMVYTLRVHEHHACHP